MDRENLISIIDAFNDQKQVYYRKKATSNKWKVKSIKKGELPNFDEYEYRLTLEEDKYAGKLISINHYEDGTIYMYVERTEIEDGEITFYGKGYEIQGQYGAIDEIDKQDETIEYMDVTVYENDDDFINDLTISMCWHVDRLLDDFGFFRDNDFRFNVDKLLDNKLLKSFKEKKSDV